MENVYEIISQQFPLAVIFESLYPHNFSNITLIFSSNTAKRVLESDTPWSWLHTEDVVMKFNLISQSLTSCPTICALLLQHMTSTVLLQDMSSWAETEVMGTSDLRIWDSRIMNEPCFFIYQPGPCPHSSNRKWRNLVFNQKFSLFKWFLSRWLFLYFCETMFSPMNKVVSQGWPFWMIWRFAGWAIKTFNTISPASNIP